MIKKRMTLLRYASRTKLCTRILRQLEVGLCITRTLPGIRVIRVSVPVQGGSVSLRFLQISQQPLPKLLRLEHWRLWAIHRQSITLQRR